MEESKQKAVDDLVPYTVKRRTCEVIELHIGLDYVVFTIDDNPDRHYHNLSIEGSYGGYAFAWNAPGPDFKGFLAKLNVDYVRGKMIGGEPEEFDGDETRTELNKEIDVMLTDGRCSSEQADEEREEISSIDDITTFWLWAKDRELFKGYDIHEFIRTCGGPRHRDFTALYEKFWPAFARELTIGKAG